MAEWVRTLLMLLFNTASENNFGMTVDTYDYWTQWFFALNGPGICGSSDLDQIHQAQFVVAYLLNAVGYAITGEWGLVPMVGYGGCGQ